MPTPHAYLGHSTYYSTPMPSSLTPSPGMNRSVFNNLQEDSISIQGIVTMSEEPTDIEHLNTEIVQARRSRDATASFPESCKMITTHQENSKSRK